MVKWFSTSPACRGHKNGGDKAICAIRFWILSAVFRSNQNASDIKARTLRGTAEVQIVLRKCMLECYCERHSKQAKEEAASFLSKPDFDILE